jgi:hypothetical protein
MKRRWDEVQYAYHVPEELRRRIGQTPVFEAGKPLKFSSFTVFLFGMLVGLLAVIMLGLALADGVGKSGWEITLLRGAAGILLGWAAWWILAGWHRERSVRATCEREYREHGILCQARVVFFEMTGLGEEMIQTFTSTISFGMTLSSKNKWMIRTLARLRKRVITFRSVIFRVTSAFPALRHGNELTFPYPDAGSTASLSQATFSQGPVASE